MLLVLLEQKEAKRLMLPALLSKAFVIVCSLFACLQTFTRCAVQLIGERVLEHHDYWGFLLICWEVPIV